MAVSCVYSTVVSSLLKQEESESVAVISAMKAKNFLFILSYFIFSCKFTENSLKTRPFLLIIMQIIHF